MLYLEIPFVLITIQTDDEAVVTIGGELDMSTAPRLHREMVSLAGQGVRRVTLDLAGLAFIDAAGIGVLVSALKRQRDNGGDLTLSSPGPSAMRVLELTGLVAVFTITRGQPERRLESSGAR